MLGTVVGSLVITVEMLERLEISIPSRRTLPFLQLTRPLKLRHIRKRKEK